MAHADNLRRHFPAARATTYLNTAHAGLVPDIAVETAKQRLDDLLATGRSGDYATNLKDVHKQVKVELSHLVNGAPTSYALTDGLSQAVDIVMWGLGLQAGDEIVVGTLVPADVLLPTFVQRQRNSIKLRYIDDTVSGLQWVETLKKSITNRTRLVVCSHVNFVTGQALPLEEIIAAAHEHDVPVLVEGAHGSGSQFIHVESLDLDFYAFPMDKWMGAPDGTGALYLHQRWLHRLEPAAVGTTSMLHPQAYDLSGYYLPKLDACRFENNLSDLCKWSATAQALQFMRVHVGWDYAYSHIHGLSGELLDRLFDIRGVRVLTPRDARAGIVSFQINGIDAKKFVQAAQAREVEIQWIPIAGPPDKSGTIVRVSAAVYNNTDDIGRLIKRVEEMEPKGH